MAPAPEPTERTLEIDAYVRRLHELIDRALSVSSGLSQELRGLVAGIDDPLRLAYLLASLLDMKAEEKQQILEADSLLAKLQAVAVGAQPRDRAARAQGQDRDRGAAGDDRRAAPVLPAPAAQGDPGRARRRREARGRRNCASGWPTPSCPSRCRPIATREVDRLERMTPASPEYQMIRTYIDWVLDVPWSTIDRRSARSGRGARQVLDEDHYDLDKVKERIVEYLAVQKLKARQARASTAPARSRGRSSASSARPASARPRSGSRSRAR